MILVARLVQPHERAEHLFARDRRDARPVVVDMDDHEPALAHAGDVDASPVALGVADEIAEAALDRHRPHRHARSPLAWKNTGAPWRSASRRISSITAGEIGRRRRLAAVAAREGEIAFEHRLHLADVVLEVGRFGVGFEHGERQAEAGEDGFQVVADAAQHRRALFVGALDAALHLDEGVAGLPHLARAARLELVEAALAEILGRLGEPQDRAGSDCAGTGSPPRSAPPRRRASRR